MDTRLLRSFLAVARLRNYTDAALELGYRQSTITAHVQKLEAHLGCTLLDRLPSGARVTEAGARALPILEEILDAELRLLNGSRVAGERPRGTVRIVAPESLCTYRLPGLVADLRAKEPEIEVWLRPGGLDRGMAEVRSGRAELALSLEPEAPVSELSVAALGREPLTFLAEPGGSEPENLSWRELAQRPALLIDEGCGYADRVFEELRRNGSRARCSRFGSIEAIKRCVAVGLGWTALPSVTAAEELRAGTLTELSGPPLPACEVSLLTHPRRHLSTAVEVVVDALREIWLAAH